MILLDAIHEEFSGRMDVAIHATPKEQGTVLFTIHEYNTGDFDAKDTGIRIYGYLRPGFLKLGVKEAYTQARKTAQKIHRHRMKQKGKLHKSIAAIMELRKSLADENPINR